MGGCNGSLHSPRVWTDALHVHAINNTEQRLKGVVAQDDQGQDRTKKKQTQRKNGDKGEKGQVAPKGPALNFCRFNTPPQPVPSPGCSGSRHP